MGRDYSDSSDSDDDQHFVQRGGKWVPLNNTRAGNRDTTYHVQRGGKWVPMDTSQTSDDGHDYFVHRNGKWVKMDLNSTLRNAVINEMPRKSTGSNQIITKVQNSQQYVTGDPNEQRQYIIYITAPPAQQPQPQGGAVLNDYGDRPVVLPPPTQPSRVPIYRRRPPPPGPPPPQPVPVRVAGPDRIATGGDYDRGREAFFRDQMAGLTMDDYPEEDPDNPGYYLAGYIHYQYPEQTQQQAAAAESVNVQTMGTSGPVQIGGLQIGYANQFAAAAQQPAAVTLQQPVVAAPQQAALLAMQQPVVAMQQPVAYQQAMQQPVAYQQAVPPPVNQLNGLPVFSDNSGNFIPIQPQVEVAEFAAQPQQQVYQVDPQFAVYQGTQAQLDGLPVFQGNADNFVPVQPRVNLMAQPGYTTGLY